MNENPLYPKNLKDVVFCDLSGEPIADGEGYYRYDLGATVQIVNETSHELLYTDKDWEKVYDEENYWSEWDYGLEEEEMTSNPPAAAKEVAKDEVYYYLLDDKKPTIHRGTSADFYQGSVEFDDGLRPCIELGTFDNIYKGFSEGNPEITNHMTREDFRTLFHDISLIEHQSQQLEKAKKQSVFLQKNATMER